MQTRPDILVLGGGGVLGDAWMTGLLAGLEDGAGFDLRRCEYFVGTSAGSIVAARLAADERLQRPADGQPIDPVAADLASAGPDAGSFARDRWGAGTLARAGAWALALGAPFARPSLSLAATPGRLLRATALRAIPTPAGSLAVVREHFEQQRFDGRLRVVTVARRNGRRVVFGSPGAPATDVGHAVEASCTVPWLFAPVEIAGEQYVDGGVWSPTNLDVAPARRDSQVLCLNPTANLRGSHPGLTAARSLSRSVMTVEAGVLRARGARVTLVGPDPAASRAIGTNLMATAPRAEVLAAGYRQGLALAR
jgi:NTE family protein